MRRRRIILIALPALAGVGLAVAQVGVDQGRIGPDKALLNNGRFLRPYGKLSRIGQFPTGGRLTPNGRFFWTVSSGRGANDVRIVSVRTGKVIQTIPMPGTSGGIAMDPVKPRVFVSGIADSHYKDQKSAPGTPGIDGDVVHVFSYSTRFGKAKREKLLETPPPSSAPVPQNFPPTNTDKVAWPDRLAVSPDGKKLLVPLNLGDAAAIVDVDSGAVKNVETGTYPYGAAILPDGKTGLVSNESPGTVSVVDLDKGTKVKDIQVGPHLSHPEAITVDPKAPRAYVPLANSDQVVVIDTEKLAVQRTLSVERPEGLGASPVDVAVTPDGKDLLVANEGTDEIAVFCLPGCERAVAAKKAKRKKSGRTAAVRKSPEWSLIGRIPTAQMPMAVDVAAPGANPCGFREGKPRGKRAARCMRIAYVSAKGLGTGPNPKGPQPNAPQDSDDRINETQYLPLLNVGSAGLADYPTDATLDKLTKIATRQIVPTNRVAKPPADTPLKPNGPIKHVFYVVRENRTYDQILGDDTRGDGDPKLTLFGSEVTPNAHALVQRFPLVDHVYANSEASIDGHFWTSAAKTPDYVHKAWFQNYGGRPRPYDFGVYSVTWPGNGFLFDQAEKQGISYYNYGEAIAGVVPLTDKDRTPEETQEVLKKFAKSDLGPTDIVPGAPTGCYPNDASVGNDAINQQLVWDSSRQGEASRFDCFKTHFQQQLGGGGVPAFNYLVLSNDHTQTLSAGKRTPRALVADNDLGLGQIVDLISKSPIWKESAIFVIEDDSQDGADHVDAHRIPALVISPFAKKGAVVHTRYDFLSVIRSMELILGMKPLGLFDELATPMYDAFQGTPDNADVYDAIPSRVPLTEKNPSGTSGARAAAKLPKCLDCIPQRYMDALLWKSVHGLDAEPPPPGPNASGRDEADEEEAEAEADADG